MSEALSSAHIERKESSDEILFVAQLVRHGDRTGPLGKPSGALSEYGRHMNQIQADYLAHTWSQKMRAGELPRIGKIEMHGSAVGYKKTTEGEALGRSGETAQTFGHALAELTASEMGVQYEEVQPASGYLSYETAPQFDQSQSLYQHNNVYNQTFAYALVDLLRGKFGLSVHVEETSDKNDPLLGAGAVYRVVSEDGKPFDEHVPEEYLSPEMKQLRDSDAHEFERIEKEMFYKLYDLAADTAQQAAKNAFMSAIVKGRAQRTHGEIEDPAFAYAERYTGGLAYLLMHYLSRAERGERGTMAVMGIHGPMTEALLKLCDASSTVSIVDTAEGMQHTSESVQLVLRKDKDGSLYYEASYNDPSKSSRARNIRLNMNKLRELALMYRTDTHPEAFKAYTLAQGEEFDPLPQIR